MISKIFYQLIVFSLFLSCKSTKKINYETEDASNGEYAHYERLLKYRDQKPCILINGKTSTLRILNKFDQTNQIKSLKVVTDPVHAAEISQKNLLKCNTFIIAETF